MRLDAACAGLGLTAPTVTTAARATTATLTAMVSRAPGQGLWSHCGSRPDLLPPSLQPVCATPGAPWSSCVGPWAYVAAAPATRAPPARNAALASTASLTVSVSVGLGLG